MKLTYELNGKVVSYNDFFMFCLKSFGKGILKYNSNSHSLTYYEK